MEQDGLAGLSLVLDSSELLTTWALSIGGASIALIVGTAHRRPQAGVARIWYLLFIPAWVGLGWSLYNGDLLARSVLAAAMVKKKSVLQAIALQMNDYYDDQRTFLLIAVSIFALWLFGYMAWWLTAGQGGIEE